MKNLSLYLNVVIIIAVGLLYYLQFSGNKVSDSVKPADAATMVGIEDNIVVYVDFDTLLLNYTCYEDLKNELIAKKGKLEAELNNKTKGFEKEVEDLKEKIQKGLVTRAKAQEMEQALMQKQQNLYQLSDNLSRELMEEEQVMNRQLQYNVLEYLEEHCKDKNYNYILSNTFGGALLYSNRGLNITQEVIEGINEHYISSKEEE